jgi:hypothetical protein
VLLLHLDKCENDGVRLEERPRTERKEISSFMMFAAYFCFTSVEIQKLFFLFFLFKKLCGWSGCKVDIAVRKLVEVVEALIAQMH